MTRDHPPEAMSDKKISEDCPRDARLEEEEENIPSSSSWLSGLMKAISSSSTGS